jgi:hypothetical protein
MACEFDRHVYELTKRNIARLDRTIDLQHGDYQSLLGACRLPPDHGLIFFIAPPWGTALDEVAFLDLRCTTPPIIDIIGFIRTTYPCRTVLLATQVHEKLNPSSLHDVQALLDWWGPPDLRPERREQEPRYFTGHEGLETLAFEAHWEASTGSGLRPFQGRFALASSS